MPGLAVKYFDLQPSWLTGEAPAPAAPGSIIYLDLKQSEVYQAIYRPRLVKRTRAEIRIRGPVHRYEKRMVNVKAALERRASAEVLEKIPLQQETGVIVEAKGSIRKRGKRA